MIWYRVRVRDLDAARAFYGGKLGFTEIDVEVGTVLELHDEMRLVDVFDPDGNRLQLGQELG